MVFQIFEFLRQKWPKFKQYIVMRLLKGIFKDCGISC